MSASPGGQSPDSKVLNMTVDECFQNRNTVLQGQPFGGIPTVLFLNIVLWVVVLLVYSFLRKAAWDYGRLALLMHNDSLTSLIYGEQSEKSSPSEISLEMERRDKGFCSWLFNSLTMKDQELINKCGDDARIYIAFQYHFIVYVLILCIPSLGIILPINYTGTVLDRSSHFGRTTIVNVSTESKLLWVHSLFAFLYFLTNFILMAHHCLGFVPRKSQKVTRTLMITYVPTDIQDPEMIIKHFQEAYPGCIVTRVHFCYDVRNLIDLDDQRRHAMRGRLYYTAKAKKTGKVMIKIHPCSRLCFCQCWTCFKEVDAEQYYGELEEQLTDEFNAELNRVQLKRLDLIFVTFQDSRMAQRSSQNLIIVHKCYIFLVFMVVILPSMGLTSLDVFLRWLFDIYYLEHATIRFQCVFLPDNGAFFVNYVITASLLGTGMELMRLGSLFMYSTRLFFSRSEPERVHIRKNQAIEFQYGREYAWMMNVFTVVMAYSITCPIIVPFGLLYLCMKHLTDRYNMYYSYAPTKLNEQIHMAAVSQAIFAPLLGLFWMLFFSILRVGYLHSITLFSLTTLVASLLIAFFGIFLGKLRIYSDYEPDEETQTVFDMEPSSASSTPTSLLYVATVLQEPELNLTPASSPARHTYGTMNSQPEEEEESGLRGFARELDSAQFQEGLELEGQSQHH
ncbi:calcium permeable stress-gated cation channel 1 isoform X3 [Octodon degus]|uniref:Calcium permeable stress-gated cation channel 1 isoform X3 n=1 Tax=Octodon degus TaxID=10160 RepID=A0A6P6DDC7_OCTDE|nr:calcium permeable stress-gated cation channel 1 isoform X3 [Octodon degus]